MYRALQKRNGLGTQMVERIQARGWGVLRSNPTVSKKIVKLKPSTQVTGSVSYPLSSPPPLSLVNLNSIHGVHTQPGKQPRRTPTYDVHLITQWRKNTLSIRSSSTPEETATELYRAEGDGEGNEDRVHLRVAYTICCSCRSVHMVCLVRNLCGRTPIWKIGPLGNSMTSVERPFVPR